MLPRELEFPYKGPESINFQLRRLFFDIRQKKTVYNPKDLFG